MHVLVGIAAGSHAERRAVDQAEKPITDVQAGIEREASGVDGAEQGQHHRHFDGARRMKPSIAALRPLKAGFVVVKRHREPFPTQFLCDFVDARRQRGKGGSRRCHLAENSTENLWS